MSTNIVKLDGSINFRDYWASQDEDQLLLVQKADQAVSNALQSRDFPAALLSLLALFQLDCLDQPKNSNMVVVAAAHLLNQSEAKDTAPVLKAIEDSKTTKQSKVRLQLLMLSLLKNQDRRAEVLSSVISRGDPSVVGPITGRIFELVGKMKIDSAKRVKIFQKLRETSVGQFRIACTLSLLSNITHAEQLKVQHFVEVANSTNPNHLFNLNTAKTALSFLKKADSELHSLLTQCLGGSLIKSDVSSQATKLGLEPEEFSRKSKICGFLKLCEESGKLPLKDLEKALGVDRKAAQRVAFEAFKYKLIEFKIDEEEQVLEVTRIRRKFFSEEALLQLRQKLEQTLANLERIS